MAKVIIIGATSGIGKALAEVYANQGFEVGITGRREEILDELKNELPTKVYVKTMDIRNTELASKELEELIGEMQEVDIIILNAGVGKVNWSLDLDLELNTLKTNVMGFTTMCNVAMQYFLSQGKGHLAGVSSIAGIRGLGGAPAYSASKAFIINYLESLRAIVFRRKAKIIITNIQPGFVDTNMGQASEFWRISPQAAAKQIYRAIKNKEKQVYVSSRWRFIAYLLKVLPGWIIKRIG